MSIRIVTDSTADITSETAEALGISVIPLSVFFEDEAYRDNIDLDSTTFYQKLAASKELPRTSQPSPALFQETYLRLIEQGADAILSIHVSGQLSGTYQAARTAWDSLPEEQKTIPFVAMDSKNVSAALFVTLKNVAALANEGASLEELVAYAEDRFARTHILVVLDTLEYVRRGGRIGSAKTLLGNMLSVKPILTLNKEGAVIPLEQPRTRSKAFARVAQIVTEHEPLEELAIAESNSEEIGTQMVDVLKTVYSGEIERYKLGAAIGTHTGPGTIGVIMVQSKDKN
ncbi:DegV family protein [Dictyobacter arantiisoli]|uniref:Fatty acid-binding protein DegV n=1 Tax=Dictyobacter arantiisoli TaxID=2014874 RepID=A0A5A5TKF1_9CHLR|nr:DegV family protein [Dictyobacter arantiisoli]GCF11374.1 fatty acid-binding protein DegV [Dictyobacter arantiisoli]